MAEFSKTGGYADMATGSGTKRGEQPSAATSLPDAEEPKELYKAPASDVSPAPEESPEPAAPVPPPAPAPAKVQEMKPEPTKPELEPVDPKYPAPETEPKPSESAPKVAQEQPESAPKVAPMPPEPTNVDSFFKPAQEAPTPPPPSVAQRAADNVQPPREVLTKSSEGRSDDQDKAGPEILKRLDKMVATNEKTYEVLQAIVAQIALVTAAVQQINPLGVDIDTPSGLGG